MWNEKKRNLQLRQESEEIRECLFKPQIQNREVRSYSGYQKFNTAPNFA